MRSNLSPLVSCLGLLFLGFATAQGQTIRRFPPPGPKVTLPALPPGPKEVWTEPPPQIARLSAALAAKAPEQGVEEFAKLLAAMGRAAAAKKNPGLPIEAAIEAAKLPPSGRRKSGSA